MPRGKPFVCWISSPGKYHDVALHIGDMVGVKDTDGSVIVGKFGCKRRGGFPYVVRCGKVEHTVYNALCLKPVNK